MADYEQEFYEEPEDEAKKLGDVAAWRQYRKEPTRENRSALLGRLDGIINAQVRRWSGPVPADVLRSQAKVMAAKAFDTYDPSKGTALSTHVTNSLLPLSRTVYSHQNTARMPENLTMKVNAYNSMVNDFKAVNGREPTFDELRDKLSWTPSELSRMRNYNVKDLVESGGEVSGKFYDNSERWNDIDDNVLGGIYMGLSPQEKRLFEYATGYNGAPVLGIAETAKRMGLTPSQVAYQKLLLRRKTEAYMNRPSVRRKYGK